jgi:hypothetical protein
MDRLASIRHGLDRPKAGAAPGPAILARSPA